MDSTNLFNRDVDQQAIASGSVYSDRPAIEYNSRYSNEDDLPEDLRDIRLQALDTTLSPFGGQSGSSLFNNWDGEVTQSSTASDLGATRKARSKNHGRQQVGMPEMNHSPFKSDNSPFPAHSNPFPVQANTYPVNPYDPYVSQQMQAPFGVGSSGSKNNYGPPMDPHPQIAGPSGYCHNMREYRDVGGVMNSLSKSYNDAAYGQNIGQLASASTMDQLLGNIPVRHSSNVSIGHLFEYTIKQHSPT